MKVERIEHIIGGRKEVPLDYLEIVTKLPQDEIIAIVKELGYRILDNKVIR